jgi:hypothetical protein
MQKHAIWIVSIHSVTTELKYFCFASKEQQLLVSFYILK